MAKKLRIETEDDTYVHFNFQRREYTLCGLEIMGDTAIGIQEGQPTEDRVNCPHCIEFVEFCKGIRRKEYE